jgi:hypothetical protein
MAGMTRLLLFLQMGQESTFKTGCDTAQGFSRFGQPFGRNFQYRAEAEQFLQLRFMVVGPTIAYSGL